MTLIRELSRKLPRRDSQRRFVAGIAFTENDQPHVVRKKSIKERDQNLETLFLHHACDHSKDRAGRRWCELELPKERVAADLFSGERAGVVVCRQELVCLRM